MKAKTFDCVEMMHHGAEQVRKRLAGMTVEEELAYWREAGEALRIRAAARHPSPDSAQVGRDDSAPERVNSSKLPPGH